MWLESRRQRKRYGTLRPEARISRFQLMVGWRQRSGLFRTSSDRVEYHSSALSVLLSWRITGHYRYSSARGRNQDFPTPQVPQRNQARKERATLLA